LVGTGDGIYRFSLRYHMNRIFRGKLHRKRRERKNSREQKKKGNTAYVVHIYTLSVLSFFFIIRISIKTRFHPKAQAFIFKKHSKDIKYYKELNKGTKKKNF
jgi:hypothetical protein